ncbi:hypothetical protein IWQ60_008137 [Tieghemiomyces parasiticus]|uniref:Uncharacterized protein n=1 Tax=Tieghemiomyces parasiticus TaxID=78921 RepID=A0A9W8DMB3_9FUNG|nr:hypothetical protein IWQ60_008137 [Tieghemiomyces parasiticus]
METDWEVDIARPKGPMAVPHSVTESKPEAVAMEVTVTYTSETLPAPDVTMTDEKAYQADETTLEVKEPAPPTGEAVALTDEVPDVLPAETSAELVGNDVVADGASDLVADSDSDSPSPALDFLVRYDGEDFRLGHLLNLEPTTTQAQVALLDWWGQSLDHFAYYLKLAFSADEEDDLVLEFPQVDLEIRDDSVHISGVTLEQLYTIYRLTYEADDGDENDATDETFLIYMKVLPSVARKILYIQSLLPDHQDGMEVADGDETSHYSGSAASDYGDDGATGPTDAPAAASPDWAAEVDEPMAKDHVNGDGISQHGTDAPDTMVDDWTTTVDQPETEVGAEGTGATEQSAAQVATAGDWVAETDQSETATLEPLEYITPVPVDADTAPVTETIETPAGGEPAESSTSQDPLSTEVVETATDYLEGDNPWRSEQVDTTSSTAGTHFAPDAVPADEEYAEDSEASEESAVPTPALADEVTTMSDSTGSTAQTSICADPALPNGVQPGDALHTIASDLPIANAATGIAEEDNVSAEKQWDPTGSVAADAGREHVEPIRVTSTLDTVGATVQEAVVTADATTATAYRGGSFAVSHHLTNIAQEVDDDNLSLISFGDETEDDGDTKAAVPQSPSNSVKRSFDQLDDELADNETDSPKRSKSD